MSILHRIRDRALWLLSYLLDPFGTAQVRNRASRDELGDAKERAGGE
jgi:hypothetical protein